MKILCYLSKLFIISLIAIPAYGQSGDFTATLDLRNPSGAIDDIIGEVELHGGEGPFIYIWNQQDVTIYEDSVGGLPEGKLVSVKVIDAEGDTAYAENQLRVNSFSERVNRYAKPAVNALQTVLFANIWSDTVKVEKYELTAPNAIKYKNHHYILKKWLVEDGATVEHLQPVAILSDNGNTF